MVQIPWHHHFGSYHPWQESIPAVSCCTVLLSAPEGTRTMSAKTKKNQTNYTLLLCVYVGELILDWNESRCTQIWQTPSVVLPPSPKMPIFFSSEWKWLHTRSNTHTQIQTGKKSKHSGALGTEGQRNWKSKATWKEDTKSQDTPLELYFLFWK